MWNASIYIENVLSRQGGSSVFELFDGLATEVSDGVWSVHSLWNGNDEEHWITKNHISCEYESKTPYNGYLDDVC